MNRCSFRPAPPCNCDNSYFNTVIISSAMGDDITGKFKPQNGAYKNTLVKYEVNGAIYFYDSRGAVTKFKYTVPTFDEIPNRPLYAGGVMTSQTSIPDVDEAVAAEAALRTEADGVLQGNINALDQKIDDKIDEVNDNIQDIVVGQIDWTLYSGHIAQGENAFVSGDELWQRFTADEARITAVEQQLEGVDQALSEI